MYKILTALFLLICTAAQAEISRPIQGKLDNGLQYTLLPLHAEKGRLEIRMKVNAGAVDENDDQAGVAHMVEHLVFRGTEKYPSGLMPYLHQQSWVRGRHYNAVTTYDNTTYMLTPPKTANLAKSLEILSQMLFHAKLNQDDLNIERKIITEEWRQGQGVASRMNQQRSSAIRSGSRYIRNPVIGTPESIAKMPASQLQHYYQTWYVPNNMQLLIVGDTSLEEAKQLIQHYFGSISAKSLPKRDYLDPILSDRLLLNKIQDPHSGVSQIAYIFRLNDGKTRTQNENGRFERIVDKIALAVLQQRLRNQNDVLMNGVSNIVVRKSDIGPSTIAIGLFASVEKDSHLVGLSQILKEIKRIKYYPITEDEFIKYKKILKTQIENASKNPEDRDFSQWVQKMVETVLMNKDYRPQVEIAALTSPLLENVKVDDINQRITEWFSATDRIINYQPPRNTPMTITHMEVEQIESQIKTYLIPPPQKEKEIIPMSLEVLNDKGKILSEKFFPKESVTEWILSNGDKVIWLKSPVANDKTYFKSLSSAGFKAAELGEWQSQLASQLIEQNAPLTWRAEQLKLWKELNNLNLFIKQTESKLIFDGSVNNSHLHAFLRLFYAYQAETKVKEGLDEAKKSISRMIDLQNDNNIENARLKALSKLRFNTENNRTFLPTKTTLESLTAKDLEKEWKKMVSAPTTFFILNNMEKTEMVELITQYLAKLPRDKRLNSLKTLPSQGQAISHFSMNIEPKDDVKMWTFTPHKWQGKDAVLISLLKNIATNKLKLSLRDQHLGLYSLQFESTLNPETQRVESELSFVANPNKTEALIHQARKVLKDIPNKISEEEIKIAKAQFIQAEKMRLKDPYTWMNRMILSETQLGNPQYLSDMFYLTEAINLKNMKEMATNLYNQDNEKIFIITPQQ